MVTIEELSVIIPGIMAVVVPTALFLVARHMRLFDKTAENSSIASITVHELQGEIHRLNDDMKDIREHFDDRLDTIMVSLEKRDEKLRDELNRVWQRIELMSASLKLTEWRLDKIDEDRKAGSKL